MQADTGGTKDGNGGNAGSTEGADVGDGDGNDAGADGKRREMRFEVVATVLLAASALATAWSGYQASLWDGIQSSDYSQASALRVESARHFNEADQFRIADLTVFENYIDASLTGETEVAEFYRTRFRDEFIPAFEAWEATDQSGSPITMDEYVLAPAEQGRDLEAQAQDMFVHGEQANDDSDMYVLTTLFFASALFFAAISERFSVWQLRAFLLGIAGVGLVVGLAITVTLPVTTG